MFFLSNIIIFVMDIKKKLNNRSPYETFSFYHGEDVLEKLACRQVTAKDIMLKPALLKK